MATRPIKFLELHYTMTQFLTMVNIHQDVRSRGEYSPMFTGPELNNCINVIFKGKYQGLQNDGLKRKKTQAQFFVGIHLCN